MNKNKKIGIMIFLALVGSLEAERHRLTNDDPSSSQNKSTAQKKPVVVKKSVKSTVPTVAAQKKANKKLKQKQKDAEAKRKKQEAKARQVSLNDAQFKSYQQAFNYGCVLYHKKSNVELLDVVQAAATPTGLIGNASAVDSIEITKSKAAPKVTYALSAVYENLPSLFRAGETTEASFGIQASFAKKDDAYQGTYKDAGTTVYSLRTRQSIKKYALEVFGQYGLFEYYGWKYNIKVAPGLSVGALRDLRIYEVGDGDKLFYTGQRLTPNKACGTVEFGLNVTKEAGPLQLIFAYDMGYVKQTYNSDLVLDKPDVLASATQQNNYDLLKGDAVRHIVLVTPPVFNVWSYNFKFGAAFDF